eukprot:RCo022360
MDESLFVERFEKHCGRYFIGDHDNLEEAPLNEVQKRRFYFFEPGLEYYTTVSSVQLLRSLRLKALHVRFGAMTFAEVWMKPGGSLNTDYLSVPAASQSYEEVCALPLLKRLQVFETLSGVDLEPVLVLNGNYELTCSQSDDLWMYLAVLTIAGLRQRACLRRIDELQRLLAQFVVLPDVDTSQLSRGALTMDRCSLSHLFHSTLSLLAKLNTVCGSPFPPYNEWELFDGDVFALELDNLFALEEFQRNKGRYDRLLSMIISNLPEPLQDTPTRPPSEAQLGRVRRRPPFATSV